MEHGHFDELTRSVAGGTETRRTVLRLLAGSVLGGLAARLGMTEAAEAKKKPKPKRRPKRKPPARPRAAGKGKGKKGKGKGKKQPPPLPPGCQSCTECQMCLDGACVPDPVLNGVRCLGSGAACGYCQGGACAASVVPPCADGVCPPHGQCCAEDRRCPDAENDAGFACIDPATMCCPDEKRCASGCVYRKACCEEDRPRCGPCGDICVNGTWRCSAGNPCADGSCVAQDACCPEQWTCADGTCVAQDQCCQEEKPCGAGVCVSANQCCPGEKPCAGGSCVAETACCPDQKLCDGSCIGEAECCADDPTPQCHEGAELICCNGQWRCKDSWDEPTCYPYGGWLEYNPATCKCECPANTVQGPGSSYCCPAGYPHLGWGNNCYGDVWNEPVCTLGFSRCEDYPAACCPDNWPPPWPGEANRDPGTARQSDAVSAESHRVKVPEPDGRPGARNDDTRKRNQAKHRTKGGAGERPTGKRR
jgi:hypothetical protein